MGFRLRAPLPQDEAGLIALLVQPKVFAGLGILPHATHQYTAALLKKNDGPNGFSLVAEAEGEIIGWAFLERFTERYAHSGNFEICVHDRVANKGVGRALMQQLLDVADNYFGLHRLEAVVFANNAPAIALYESLGFAHEGTRRNALIAPSGYVDAHIMGRLRPKPMGAAPT